MIFQKRVEAVQAKFQEAIDELLDLMGEHPTLEPILEILHPSMVGGGVTYKNTWHAEAVLSDGHAISETVEMENLVAVETRRVERQGDKLVPMGTVLMLLAMGLEEG